MTHAVSSHSQSESGEIPQTNREVKIVDLTYSDLYVFFQRDHQAEAYFNELPGYIQDQIRSRKHAPGSLSALKQMAEDAEKVF